ncbi:MAG: sulfate transporter [Frankiales bacterium]|nr:sulfate transporter [Frankiales bacterium]
MLPHVRHFRPFLAATLLLVAGCSPGSTAPRQVVLTVVGTSDVFDSHLVQDVLKPGFEKAHPGVRLDYVSKGSGAAIAYAKAGTASALLVHAASLENQFVADGFSLERFGRAVFYGDYVLLGPADDPAGVRTGAPHDVVHAFQRIAAAGAAGRASFVSRGGTPGTTVQEHRIWALASGVTLCAVSKADGGGSSPTAAAGACPPATAYPSWYHATGLSQGPNVVNAEACNYAVRGCYVLTDRGTYDYLASTKAVSDLRVVTALNAAAAPGGSTLLVNSFHAYAVNPGAFPARVAKELAVPQARAFLDWLTSPEAQSSVAAFLSHAFTPDAAPLLRAEPLPSEVAVGASLTVRGGLTNAAPGTPPLAGQVVTLLADGSPVATATTAADGSFVVTATPTATASWALRTGTLQQVENATLDPVFGDLLAPVTRDLGTVHLR